MCAVLCGACCGCCSCCSCCFCLFVLIVTATFVTAVVVVTADVAADATVFVATTATAANSNNSNSSNNSNIISGMVLIAAAKMSESSPSLCLLRGLFFHCLSHGSCRCGCFYLVSTTTVPETIPPITAAITETVIPPTYSNTTATVTVDCDRNRDSAGQLDKW